METEKQLSSSVSSSSGQSVQHQQFENLEFKNPAEVRELIKRLQMVEERMEKNTNQPALDHNSNSGAGSSPFPDFDSLPLVDLNDIKFESEDTW